MFLVKKLFAAGEESVGTNEMAFITTLSVENYAQLREIFKEYKNSYNNSIENVIESEFSGSIEEGLLAIGDLIIFSAL